MSITVNLYYEGKNGSSRKFVEEMEASGIADAIRAEEGNLRYDYFQSFSNPDVVLLIDTWTSQKALDEHHQSPMMQDLAELREKYDLTMRVERLKADLDYSENQDQEYIRK